MYGNHKIITLCGSTKFQEDFLRMQKELTMQGNIVFSLGVFSQSGDVDIFKNKSDTEIAEIIDMLSDIHKSKIALSDEIYVINRGGYIGESTKREIYYAKSLGKPVQYMEPCEEDIEIKAIYYPVIKKYLRDHDLTLNDFSILCDISISTMSRILNGQVDIKKKHIDKILAATGLSYEYAFGLSK